MDAMEYVVRVLFGATTAASASVRGGEQQSEEDRNVYVVVMTWSTLGVCLLTVLVILCLRYGTL